MSQLPPLTTADYDRALEMWPTELVRLARNISMVPRWIGDTDRFWFREELAEGCAFRLVDAPTGKVSPAFDHDLVARLLDAKPEALPFAEFDYAGEEVIEFRQGGEIVRLDLARAELSRRPVPGPALVSPQGERLVVRDFNLWIEDAKGGERALTTDGEEFFAWGSTSDMDYARVARNRGAPPRPPVGCVWSPDGARLLAQQIDERHIEPYHYLESVPVDGSPRPKVHSIRMSLAGEAERGTARWHVLDKDGGGRVAVAALPGRLEIDIASFEPVWRPDGATVYAVASASDASHLALIAIDAATGAVRIIHEERSETFIDLNTYIYNRANAALMAGRGEMLWYSQADGWGHLYAIALKDGVVRRLTAGDWAVLDVIAVTATQVFFSAGGREPGRNPYFRHLYRIDLDGEGPNAGLRLLTPDDADHGFIGEPAEGVARVLGRPVGLNPMSPSARYFVDTVSRVDLPPTYVLRDADGQQIAEVLRADISALEATGWTPPEMFTAKAADGKTDLYGILIKPRAFAERASWPVLERIYGGPQINVYPRSFSGGLNGSFTHAINAMAEMGFVVALMDGPGTPSRSKAFHDMTYGQDDRWGVGHHRAALEDAAATRPWMDLGKVGVSGHSYGGYGTAMALLLEPDFYKVGVSSAGMYDLTHIYAGGVERHLGRSLKASHDDTPADYGRMSPSTYADRLAGDLMLVFGDLDENAPPAGLLAFVKALVDAGKGYDLLYLPGANHNFVPWPYFQKRMWDYFIEHIQGRAPLRHHRLDVAPGPRMFI